MAETQKGGLGEKRHRAFLRWWSSRARRPERPGPAGQPTREPTERREGGEGSGPAVDRVRVMRKPCSKPERTRDAGAGRSQDRSSPSGSNRSWRLVAQQNRHEDCIPNRVADQSVLPCRQWRVIRRRHRFSSPVSRYLPLRLLRQLAQCDRVWGSVGILQPDRSRMSTVL
jgi:hypothetical protein